MSADARVGLGWIGVGRMGLALASRLLEAGHDVAVYNRTRSKAEPLAELGATIVDSPADLGRPGCRVHDGGRICGRRGCHQRTRRAAVARRRPSWPDHRLHDDLAGGGGGHPCVRGAPRDRDARGAGQRQPEGCGERPADDLSPRAPHDAWVKGRPYLEMLGAERHLRRRGRAGAASEDLPQPDARRRRAVHGRGHGAGREGRACREPTSWSS